MTADELRAARWEAYLGIAWCVCVVTSITEPEECKEMARPDIQGWFEEWARLWRLTNQGGGV